ncbi:MAG: helix-turn-helix transcriptional regulator [Acidimicrobiales bacterium]
MARRPRRTPPAPPPPLPPEVDLNQVVAYNVRAARELRGWTQEHLADRLEPYLGQRITQAAVSAIERAWDGDRRREFDAHELLIFAMVFNLPIIWFLLPPPDDHRLMRKTTRQVDELYTWLLGRPDQLQPLYQRLADYGIADPTAAEEAVERITGQPSPTRLSSYRERRKQILIALLDNRADELDKAADELGQIFDHLRQVGIRGFIAEHTNDADYAYRGGQAPDNADLTASDATRDETASDQTVGRRQPRKRARKAAE